MEQNRIVFDAELIRRYDVAGPRYTSYPTAVQFYDLPPQDYRVLAAQTNVGEARRPLSLYFHLPFCDTVCFYCACSKIITKNRRRTIPYLTCLHQEIVLQAALFDRDRTVEQLHWGGGTPTFLSHEQMRELMQTTRRHFRLRDDDRGDYSLEVDPCEIDAGTMPLLRELGFNRLSIGVQDFDPRVQQAVNRIQTKEQTFGVLHEARALGFRSINFDLIYGLPLQSVSSFARTLDVVIDAGPDRLSVFNYAHLPDRFKVQRQINAADLPSPQVKLEILQMTIERLTAAGYVYIGMDHFARPDDSLAIAQRNGTLHRNFQGYATHADCDLIGLGVTSIGRVGNAFTQNEKRIGDYQLKLSAGNLAVTHGFVMSMDDRIREAVIMQLICHFCLTPAAIERQFEIDFSTYFANELNELGAMAADGLIRMEDGRIEVQPAGRLLIRNICMVFDKYLQARKATYSKVI